MLKKLLNIQTGPIEFVVKFLLVLFLIMPGCMGGAFWIGLQIDTALHIHLLKFLLPFIGTILGVYLTALLIAAGHTRQLKEV
jgi:hypothetical protein